MKRGIFLLRTTKRKRPKKATNDSICFFFPRFFLDEYAMDMHM